MPFLSQSDIDELISCAKEVLDPPRREMRLDGAHWRNDAKLIAVDEPKREFRMFMRRNEDFPENFSIGLVYVPRDQSGEVELMRCNGKHGSFNRSFEPGHPHNAFHIHKANEQVLREAKSAWASASETKEYASYQEALRYFVKAVSLVARDARAYFPDTVQFTLPLN